MAVSGLSLNRARSRVQRSARAAGGAVRRRVPRGSSRPSTAAAIGFAAVVVPWLLVVVARALSPDLGRGVIVADPWSLLAPGIGAWSLIGLLVVAAAALVAWARDRLPAPDLSRTTVVALIALVAFTVWCAASIVWWSPSPGGAWRWTVLAMVMLVASGLGLMVGTADDGRRGLAWGVFAAGFGSALVGLVDLLAFPDGALRVGSPLDPTATAMLTGLALLVALGLDGELHPQRRRWSRAAATLLLAALLLSASRSAVVLTAVGLVVLHVRGQRAGWALVQVAAGALPALLTALLPGGLARAGGGDTLGRALTATLLVGGAAVVGWNAARDTGAPAALRRWAGDRRVLVGAPLVVVLVVVGLAAQSSGGLTGAWDRTSAAVQARSTPGVPADASRLWSSTSDGRWWRWQASLDAYQQSGQPLLGVGPGSSAQTLRRYRRDASPALTPSSAPIAALTESGAVGLALLLIAALALSLSARAQLRDREVRDGALLLTIGTVVLLHALINDTLLQPMLLIPAFAAVAALGARPSVEQVLAPAPVEERPPLRRTLATAFGVAVAVVVAFGVLAPARAQLKAREAEALMERGDPAALRDASLFANQATQLDPLGIQGDAIGALAALRLQRWTEARRLAQDAIRRAPDEASAWRSMAYVALAEYDRPGARTASRRLMELDPSAPTTREIAIAATLASAPPEASPTAIGTPLTPLGG